MQINNFCDRIIRWGFYLLFGLVPLLFTPWNYELFEFNKMIGVYMLTIIITGAWIAKSITQRELRVARTPLDIPILLFLSSQLLSSFFSIDPHVSWFGYYSRFNGGMLSIVSYVLLYYAFVSNLANGANLTNLIKLALATGAVVALYGVAERLGVDKHLWVQDVQNRVFSTLGQPNWLAAYLVALAPLAMALGLKAQNPKQFWIWSFIAALFFAVLLFTRSRSGLLGFVVADVVFWVFVFLQKKRPLISFVILHISFVILFVFFGPSLPISSLSRTPVIEATPSASYAAALLETGGTESGTIRKYVWQGATRAWQSSLKTLALGTGTETFAFAFYQYRPMGHNLTSEWDFLYNKAHNEYLNYLATTGLFGLGSYLLFIGVFLVWFVSRVKYQVSGKNKNMTHDTLTLDTALFSGWISILVTNFFGFSVVVVQLFLFLFPAIVITPTKHTVISIPVPRWASWIVVLLTVILVILVGLTWYADTLYASGYRQSRAGQYGAALSHLSRASVLNPLEPVFADELGSVYAGLVTAAVEEKDATKAAQLVKQSLAASDRALATSPKNVNFWKTRTKIYYSFSEFDPVFNDAAIEALEKAALLSPNDPKITYNLAILYGRKGTNEKAIELLNTTISLKPNYRDAYFALWVFYTEVKKPELARTVLTDYLDKVDPADKDFLERLNQ
ncbi:MAG: hypothetical protein UX37_C0031G0011 [Microgenomates group bacterium GW2011_GWA2_46_16]|nr:MAG: hypothetical protein UX37_C0031G0011 [Microgenomates group bacterium GW2011_GWA2_46_16]